MTVRDSGWYSHWLGLAADVSVTLDRTGVRHPLGEEWSLREAERAGYYWGGEATLTSRRLRWRGRAGYATQFKRPTTSDVVASALDSAHHWAASVLGLDHNGRPLVPTSIVVRDVYEYEYTSLREWWHDFARPCDAHAEPRLVTATRT